MGIFVVKQPSGKYAVFSEIVDTFTEYDLSTEEAIQYFVDRGLQWEDARDKVLAAYDEIDMRDRQPKGDGYRYRYALGVIADVHGQDEVEDIVKLLGGVK